MVRIKFRIKYVIIITEIVHNEPKVIIYIDRVINNDEYVILCSYSNIRLN